MIITAHACEEKNFADIFDQMYKLRACQFKERREWSVDVVSGRERDQFDEMGPLYVCVVNSNRRLLASLRLLPTTGPHMLSNVFPEVMGEAGIVRNPLIIESSRFCVDTRAVKELSYHGVNAITRELLMALFDTARSAGMTHVISVYDVFMERVLRRAGCTFERLGPVVDYDGLKTVGGLCEASQATIDSICNRASAERGQAA